jgi:hypothetical protein
VIPQVWLVPVNWLPFAVNFESSQMSTLPDPALPAVDAGQVTATVIFAPTVRLVCASHMPPSYGAPLELPLPPPELEPDPPDDPELPLDPPEPPPLEPLEPLEPPEPPEPPPLLLPPSPSICELEVPQARTSAPASANTEAGASAEDIESTPKRGNRRGFMVPVSGLENAAGPQRRAAGTDQLPSGKTQAQGLLGRYSQRGLERDAAACL